LVRYKITKSKANIYSQLDAVSRHINFYATPGKYERFKGLGTDAPNFFNASLMMASGNMLCSEQATLAVQAFSHQYKQSRLDLVGHTNGELFINGRWVIVDPMFDMHIKNRDGLPASFDEIQRYLQGDRSILRLPKKLLLRTQKYLDLYKKERFKASPTAPRKTYFGNRFTSPTFRSDINIGVSPEKIVQALKEIGIDFDKTFTPHYLALYVMPNIIYLLENSEDPAQKADFIQDVLLEKIQNDPSTKIPFSQKLFLARQYQILNRFDKAMALYNKMKQTERVKFYKAQIYFQRGEKKAFKSLRRYLGNDLYYKYMYFKLFNRFLEETDKELLENFAFRHDRY